MVFLRKVSTASEATAVQIADRRNRRDVVLEHLGAAHTEAELSGLMQAGRERIDAGQGILDLGTATLTSPATITSKQSRLLLETLQSAWTALGFTAIGDGAFFQLVAACLIEPTSMSDPPECWRRSGSTRCIARR